jgi:hypothetical protein
VEALKSAQLGQRYFVHFHDLVACQIEHLQFLECDHSVRDGGDTIALEVELLQTAETLKVVRERGQAVVAEVQLYQQAQLKQLLGTVLHSTEHERAESR